MSRMRDSTFAFVQMADDLHQGLDFLLRGAGQLVQDEQTPPFVELLQNAESPALLAGAGERCAQDIIHGAHHVVEPEGVDPRGADANDAVTEMVEAVPCHRGGQRALAIALLAADGDRGQVVAAGQPIVEQEQLAAAAAETLELIEAQIVRRAVRICDIHGWSAFYRIKHGTVLATASSASKASAKTCPSLSCLRLRWLALASSRISSARTRRANWFTLAEVTCST